MRCAIRQKGLEVFFFFFLLLLLSGEIKRYVDSRHAGTFTTFTNHEQSTSRQGGCLGLARASQTAETEACFVSKLARLACRVGPPGGPGAGGAG